jgi:hypothetical protein
MNLSPSSVIIMPAPDNKSLFLCILLAQMVKNLIGWMVVGVGWLLDVNDFTQLLMVHVRLDYTFDFSVTQPSRYNCKALVT